jgi:hypothetical protein
VSTPRRKKGFRTISVDGTTFRWRLQAGLSGRLTIYGADSDSARLVVELPGLRDPWLFINEVRVIGKTLELSSSVQNEPALVTPSFVRAAILAGLAQGFRPELRVREFVLRFQDGAFSGH